MRDAFGGAFMIQVFLVFILIYICFTALALNYAKAFKVKNAVIEYLEKSEIVKLDNLSAEQVNLIDNFLENEVLGNMNYNLSEQNICQYVPLTGDSGRKIAYCHDSGIVIRESGRAENTEGVYYTVSTYIGWSMPFLNALLSLNGNNQSREVPAGMWEIKGQTRLIVSG